MVAAAAVETNTTAIADHETRIGTAEGAIADIQAIVATGDDSNAKLREAISGIQAIVSTGADSNAKLREELTRVAGLVDDEETGLAAAKEVADAALAQAGQNATDIAAIAGDYVKASDLVNDVYIFQCGTSDTNFHVVPAKN